MTGAGGVWPALSRLVIALCTSHFFRRRKTRSLSPPNENEKAPLLWVLTVTEARCSQLPQPERCKGVPFLVPSLGVGSSCFLWPNLRNFHAAPPLLLPQGLQLFSSPLHCCSPGAVLTAARSCAKPGHGGSP